MRLRYAHTAGSTHRRVVADFPAQGSVQKKLADPCDAFEPNSLRSTKRSICTSRNTEEGKHVTESMSCLRSAVKVTVCSKRQFSHGLYIHTCVWSRTLRIFQVWTQFSSRSFGAGEARQWTIPILVQGGQFQYWYKFWGGGSELLLGEQAAPVMGRQPFLTRARPNISSSRAQRIAR